ncbi:MAG: NfeD family protein [Acidovorax sp.]|uniref:NfeD family protein n=1 Tax=Acidovorax sp. TaxID=1872122 RepID=UPI0039E311C1
MQESTLWWLAAGALVVAELVTGTFYLLMVATGFIAGALAAHLGFALPVQIAAAAIVGAGLVVALHQMKKRRPGDRSVHLDLGETVLVETWNPDGTSTVKYRGAQWTAIHRPGSTPATGPHRVAELVGNRLLVDPI